MKKYLFLFSILYSAITIAQTTTITTAQEKNLKENARQLIISFNNNLGMLGDASLKPDEKKVYSNDNLSKFESEKVKIFNDLDPTGGTGKEFSIKIYQNNIITWFPDGVTLTFLNYNTSDVYTDNSGNFLIIKVQYESQIKGTNINGIIIDEKKLLDAYIKFPFTLQTNNYSSPKISKIGYQTNDLKDYKKATVGKSEKEQNFKEDNKEPVKLSLTPAEEKTFTSSAVLLAEQTMETFKGLGDNNVSFPEDKPLYKSKILERIESPSALISNDIEAGVQGSDIAISKYLDDFVNIYPDGIVYKYSKPQSDVVYNNIAGNFFVVKAIFELELDGTDINGKKLSSKKLMDVYVKYTDKGSQIYKIGYHTDSNPELEKILVTESADAKSNSNQKLINDLLNAKKESEDKLKKKIQELEMKIEEAKKARHDAELEKKKKEEEQANLVDKKKKDKYSYADGYKTGTILKLFPTRGFEMLGVIGIEQKLFERKEHYISIEPSFGKYFGVSSVVGTKMNPTILDTAGNDASQTSDDDNKIVFKSGWSARIELKYYYRLKTLKKMYFSFLYYRSVSNYNLTGKFPVQYVGGGVMDSTISFDVNRSIGGGYFVIGQQKQFGKSRFYRDMYFGIGIRKWSATSNYKNTKINSDTNFIPILGYKIGYRFLN